MEIVLISPPTSFEQIYGDWDLSGVDTYCPPLGLMYIASYIRQNGYSPHIIDAEALKMGVFDVVDYALDLNADAVGLSAKTINILNANSIAEGLRIKGFNGPIIIGGAHFSAAPKETMMRFGAIDYGVMGEGEATFLELLDTIWESGSIESVAGLAWRDGDKDIIINSERPLINDLDKLPFPAWDLLPNFPEGYRHSALQTKRLPAASIITSRGCPFHCTFCDRAVFGSKVRQHSAEYTLNMIRHLVNEYGIRDLMILDDNFILNKNKLFKICDKLIEEHMDLTWYCMGHAAYVTKDRIEKIKQAGCWYIEMGIEVGCDRILKLLKKNTSKEEIAAAVKIATDGGLKVKGNFIFGLPGETKESLEETIQFAKSINISYFQQNFLTIWPGCDLSREPEKYGAFENDWTRLAHQRITFIPRDITEEDLIKASRRAFREFYLRPKIILRILMSLTSFRALQNVAVAFVAFIKTMFRKKDFMGRDIMTEAGEVGSLKQVPTV